jgi:hypothetical protein
MVRAIVMSSDGMSTLQFHSIHLLQGQLVSLCQKQDWGGLSDIIFYDKVLCVVHNLTQSWQIGDEPNHVHDHADHVELRLLLKDQIPFTQEEYHQVLNPLEPPTLSSSQLLWRV